MSNGVEVTYGVLKNYLSMTKACHQSVNVLFISNITDDYDYRVDYRLTVCNHICHSCFYIGIIVVVSFGRRHDDVFELLSNYLNNIQ